MSHWCPGLGAWVGEPTHYRAFFPHLYGSWYLGITCRAAVKLDSESVHSCHTQRTSCSPVVFHSFTRCLSCRIWPKLHERKLGPLWLQPSINDHWSPDAEKSRMMNICYSAHTSYSAFYYVLHSKTCPAPTTAQPVFGLLRLFIASSYMFKHYSYALALSSVQTLSRSCMQASGNSDLNKRTCKPGWSSSTSCGFPARIKGACQMTGAVTAIMADHLLSGTHKSWQCAHRRGGGASRWWVCTLPHAV